MFSRVYCEILTEKDLLIYISKECFGLEMKWAILFNLRGVVISPPPPQKCKLFTSPPLPQERKIKVPTLCCSPSEMTFKEPLLPLRCPRCLTSEWAGEVQIKMEWPNINNNQNNGGQNRNIQ